MLGGVRAFSPRPAAPSVRRFVVPAPALSAGFDTPVRLSPDGRFVLYSSGHHLAVRDLERPEPIEVAGSEGATGAFWSPDGKHVAFVKEGALWTSALGGAEATVVTTGISGIAADGGDWSEDGTVVVARASGGLYLIPAAGGEARLLLRPDSTEIDFRGPQFLPDGRHILAVARRTSGPLAVALIAYPEGVRKNLGAFENLVAARYAPSGQLLLTFGGRENAIMAVRFSRSRLTIDGPPRLVASGGFAPSVSVDGSLAYAGRVAGDSTSAIFLVPNGAMDLDRDTGGK